MQTALYSVDGVNSVCSVRVVLYEPNLMRIQVQYFIPLELDKYFVGNETETFFFVQFYSGVSFVFRFLLFLLFLSRNIPTSFVVTLCIPMKCSLGVR